MGDTPLMEERRRRLEERLTKPVLKMTKKELRQEVYRLRRALKKAEDHATLMWASKI